MTSGSSRLRSQYQSSGARRRARGSTCGTRRATGGVARPGEIVGSGHRRASLNGAGRPNRDRYDFDLMPPVTTPIPFTAEELDAVAYNADGLVPAIVQEAGHEPGPDVRAG